MKTKYKTVIRICLALLLAAFYLNWEFEVIAFHPFKSDGQHDLKVMTWNVHCAMGADSVRQKRIAELILKEDADFILLNEYNQDSCSVIDSHLKKKYPFTEESLSHKKCGDIFYSKHELHNSCRFYIRQLKRFQLELGGEVYPERLRLKSPPAIVANIIIGKATIRVLGTHFMSNNSEESTAIGDGGFKNSYDRYKKAQEKRIYDSHWIKEAVIEDNRPIIVMGDMNDFNCSVPLDTLASCGLMDAWWEGGNGYGHTFHYGWMRLRIDHILHSKELKLQSIKVIETDLSDHNPVVAGFSISK